MKYALVTGTSRGIGAGLAEAMVDAGWRVFGISRTRGEKGLVADPRDTGEKLLRSLGDRRIENGSNVDLRELS